MSDKKKMIIVESKAKTQSIGKIVGPEYKVLHCLGHIYDLPPKELGIDVDHGFEPIYKVVPGKSKLIKQLKDEAKDVDEIILATDPDREGESIAWHLEKLFPKKKTYRMTFNEITAKAINEALNNITEIDMRLVDAQQARRVLDRLVGYKISPLLWRNLNNSHLSAGRVQSVALRMVCEREREIEKFDAKEYWTITGVFNRLIEGKESIEAEYTGIEGENLEIPNETSANEIKDILEKCSYVVKDVQKKKERRRPYAPFITSSLQQEAAGKLRFSASKTMSIAQQLYEGIEMGADGVVGLITYMRTDSVRVSGDAQAEARDYISKRFGDSYVPAKPHVFKSKKGAQDAHEAIRPTSVLYEPKEIQSYLSKDQHKLYKLIWARFIASQMEAAAVSVTRIDIAGDDKYMFRASGSVIEFDGYLRVYSFKSKDNKNKKPELPDIGKDENMDLADITPFQHFTKPPARYSEASLVRELEERGIGRPSTYVPTIETLKKRDYVRLEKRSFKPTKWGFIINDLLGQNFSEIVDYEFTARMENDLDNVESGDIQWQSIVENFYGPFAEKLKKASKTMKYEEKTDEKCDECGAEMVVKTGKYGLFLGCSKYPDCTFTKPYGDTGSESPQQKKPPVPTGEKCDKCGKEMVIRTGRYGMFMACSGYPKCKNKKPYIGDIDCPKEECEGKLVIRRTKKGRMFYGCSKYPDCDFVSWQAPIQGEKCPVCGSFMKRAKHEGENVKKCARESCGKIVPYEE